MSACQIITDAAADWSEEMFSGLHAISVVPMEIEIGGQQFTHGIRFPSAQIMSMEIGPVSAAHTGPGMLSVAFWGGEDAVYDP